MPPLSREFLLARGSCCGHRCINCPYNNEENMSDNKTCVGCKYAEWSLTPSGKIIDGEPGVCHFPMHTIKPPAAAMDSSGSDCILGPIFTDLDGCPQRADGEFGSS